MERSGYELVERDPTVEEYRRMRRAVGWSAIADEAAAAGLPSALFSSIQDIAVLPAHDTRSSRP